MAISKHFPVSYQRVSMAAAGPRTIARAYTLEDCHPANRDRDTFLTLRSLIYKKK